MERRLLRSRNKKVIAGVAGGLGDYLNVDPVIIRIIMVLLTIFNGIGILVYIIMWIVIPEEEYNPKTYSQAENTTDPSEPEEETETVSSNEVKPEAGSSNGRIVVGVILILIGIIFLSERFFPFFDFEFVFAAGMVILGIFLIHNSFKKTEKSS